MKKPLIWCLLAIALGCVGCVVTSVYPYYLESDAITDARLAGEWQVAEDSEPKEVWVFTPREGKSYGLVQKGKTDTTYTVRLFKQEGQAYLDLLPEQNREDYVPPHYLVKVVGMTKDLEITLLRYDWLRDQVEANPGVVRHLVLNPAAKREDRRIVVTADTKELQAWMKTIAAKPEAWTDKVTLKRMPRP